MAARIARAVGITTARRAAVLALVVGVVVLSIAVPLRNYLEVRHSLDALHGRQAVLADRVAQLERRRALWNTRAYTEVQARERLRYVYPGRTPYIVQLPDSARPYRPDRGPVRGPVEPWYARLWGTLSGPGR